MLAVVRQKIKVSVIIVVEITNLLNGAVAHPFQFPRELTPLFSSAILSNVPRTRYGKLLSPVVNPEIKFDSHVLDGHVKGQIISCLTKRIATFVSHAVSTSAAHTPSESSNEIERAPSLFKRKTWAVLSFYTVTFVYGREVSV